MIYIEIQTNTREFATAFVQNRLKHVTEILESFGWAYKGLEITKSFFHIAFIPQSSTACHFDQGIEGYVVDGHCYNLLGLGVEESLQQIRLAVKGDITLSGRYTIVYWHLENEMVHVLTDLIEPDSLWYQQIDEDKIAISQSVSALASFRCSNYQINSAVMQATLVCGFIPGGNHYVQGIRRLYKFKYQHRSRDLKLTEYDEYVRTQLQYIQVERTALEALDDFADELLKRVQKIIETQNVAALLLTGGRDSRMIASAIAKLGKPPSEVLTRADVEEDRPIAEKICAMEGWPLSYIDRLQVDIGNKELIWKVILVSDGLESLRQIFSYDLYGQGREYGKVLLHGLGGELLRTKNFSIKNAEEVVAEDDVYSDLAYGSLWGVVSEDAHAYLFEHRKRLWNIFQDVEGKSRKVHQWGSYLYIAEKMNCWGADSLRAKSFFGNRVSPLFMKQIAILGRLSSAQDKLKETYVLELIERFQASLLEIPFDSSGQPLTTLAYYVDAIHKKIRSLFSGSKRSSNVPSKFKTLDPNLRAYFLRDTKKIKMYMGEEVTAALSTTSSSRELWTAFTTDSWLGAIESIRR